MLAIQMLSSTLYIFMRRTRHEALGSTIAVAKPYRAQETVHAVHWPHYNPAGTVSLLVYCFNLEEDADAAAGNPARARPPDGDPALWHTGHQHDPHFSTFHQALNRAHWSPLKASRHLLRLSIETFVQAGGTLDSVIDETLERRWGAKIRKPVPVLPPQWRVLHLAHSFASCIPRPAYSVVHARSSR
jgi:DDE superfamily endonuclease